MACEWVEVLTDVKMMHWVGIVSFRMADRQRVGLEIMVCTETSARITL
jgi:hypothetical protein